MNAVPYTPRNAKQEKKLQAAYVSGKPVTLNGHRVLVTGRTTGFPIKYMIRPAGDA